MMRRWTVLWLALLALASARQAFAQPSPVSSQFSFAQAILTNSVITNFRSGAQITLAAGQTVEVTSNLVVDGTSNNVVFSGSKMVRIFHVKPNATLTLRNLQFYDGTAAAGGAIYNEGTLNISNCAFGGNIATNASGVNGSTNHSSGNGGPGTSGLPASGGAIYSTGNGALVILNSTLTNNAAKAGNGGNGGDAVAQFVFGDNGGNAGDGAPANGGAIYSASTSNFIYASIFQGNTCVCGAGGLGGAAGSGRFEGEGGTGGIGGSGAGGAIFCQRKLVIGASFLENNGVDGGATAPASTSANNYANGQAGGAAMGGAIYLGSAASGSLITNSTILGNFCIGGIGANSVSTSHAGDGGAALGAGVASAASIAQILYCTVATNLVTPGAAGTASGGGGRGSVGLGEGEQVYASPGGIRLVGSILAGAPPGTLTNASGVGDAGFNLSSDSSFVTQESSLANRNPFLSVSVASVTVTTNILTNGVLVTNATYPTANFEPPVTTNEVLQTNLAYPTGLNFINLSTTLLFVGDGYITNYVYDLITGYTYTNTAAVTNVTSTTNFFASDNGGPTPTLALDTAKSPAFEYITGIPGISFPLTDQRLYYRVSPTTIGAFDPNGVPTVSSNIPGVSALYEIQITNGSIAFPLSATNYTFTNIDGVTNLSFFSLTTGNYTNIPDTNVEITLQRSNTPSFTTNYFATNVPIPSIVGPAIIGLGQTATLTATVPYQVRGLGFQWQLNGVNLTNNAYYSGVTTSNLMFKNITKNDAGNYSVIAGTTLMFTETSAPPWSISVTNLSKVTFTAPAANARTGAEFVTVRGVFTEADTVTNIELWVTNLNNDTSTNITPVNVSFGRTSGTWSAVVEPEPGTNVLAAWADDLRGPGFTSLVAARKFFSIARMPISLSVNPPGAGTLSLRDGAKLNIGQTYTIVARPGGKWIFSAWIASTNGGAAAFLGDDATLRFEMESNLALTATFITNEFAGSTGTYNGLFYSTNTNAAAPIGIINGLILSRNGSYSAKVFALGFQSNSPMTGVFAASNGVSTNAVTNAATTLSLTMTYTNGLIFGMVSNAAGSSPLLMERAVKTNLTAAYTVLLLPQDARTNDPRGDGYALMTNRQGTTVISGTLADGTIFSQSVGVSSDGVVALYAPLYSDGGAVTGWITPEGLSESNLLWIKPQNVGSLFVGGFTNVLSAQSARWIAPRTGELAVPTMVNGGLLTFSNGYLPAPVTFEVALSSNGRLTTTNASLGQLLGVVNPKNGLFTVTLTNDDALSTGHGVLLQTAVTNGIVGGGYFLTASNSGTMTLVTNSP